VRYTPYITKRHLIKIIGHSGKGKKRRKKGVQSTDHLNSEEDEVGVEGIIDASGTEGEEMQSPPHSKSRPKALPSHRQPSDAEGGDEDVFGPASSPKFPSPSKRHAPQQVPLQHDVTSNDEEPHGEDHSNPEISQEAPHAAVNGHRSPPPNPPRKRQRESMATEFEDPERQENNDPLNGLPIQSPSPSQSHISVADVKNRRKRARR
jgi:cohesin complex subunit SA-1/2